MSEKKIEIRNVVNVKKEKLKKYGYNDFQEWNKNPEHIYIGRNMSFYVEGTNESKWHNPFPVKKGNKKYKTNVKRYSLDESLKMYREYVESNDDLMNSLQELDDKILGCWCKPSRCHGDILKELVLEHCN